MWSLTPDDERLVQKLDFYRADVLPYNLELVKTISYGAYTSSKQLKYPIRHLKYEWSTSLFEILGDSFD